MTRRFSQTRPGAASGADAGDPLRCYDWLTTAIDNPTIVKLL